MHFDNERYTGVNVIERFKKEKPSLPVFNTDTLVTLPVNTLPGTTFPKRGTRLLPPISKTTIVDNTRTLWSRTIFGKPVNVKFRTFCQLWQWPTDHQIHCEGWILFNFFGNKNTYKVFDFTKSVSFIWNYKD